MAGIRVQALGRVADGEWRFGQEQRVLPQIELKMDKALGNGSPLETNKQRKRRTAHVAGKSVQALGRVEDGEWRFGQEQRVHPPNRVENGQSAWVNQLFRYQQTEEN